MVKDYITYRKQRVGVKGTDSTYVDVTSRVQKGSVLGLLLFPVISNDITKGVDSNIRIHADDCVVYRSVKNSNDRVLFQRDLDCISGWCER